MLRRSIRVLCGSHACRSAVVPAGLALLVLAITSAAWLRVLGEREAELDGHLTHDTADRAEALDETFQGSFGALSVLELAYIVSGGLDEQSFAFVSAAATQATGSTATQFAWIVPDRPAAESSFRVAYATTPTAPGIVEDVDAAVDPSTAAGLQRARDTGQPVALLSPSDQTLVTVVKPLYRGTPPVTIEQRRDNLAAFALGSFSLPAMLRNSVQPLGRELDVLLFSPNSAVPIAAFSGDGSPVKDPRGNTRYDQATIELFGENWTLIGQPATGAVTLHTRETSSVLLAGGILAIIVAGFARLQLTRNQRVQQLVSQRTAQLEEEIRGRTTTTRQLLRSQEMLAAAQAVAHVGSWHRNVVTGDVSWSDEVYRILDLQPDQLGDRFSDLLERVHPDDRAAVQTAFDAAIEHDGEFDLDHRLVRPDGTVRTVNQSAAVTRDEHDRPQSVIGTIDDITEHVRAEREVQASEARFRNIFQSSANGMMLTDNDGSAQMVNSAFCEILGLDHEFVGGAPLESIFSPDNLPEIRHHIDTHLRGEPIESALQLTIVHQDDGAQHHVTIRSRPFIVNGEGQGLISEFRDVTELRESRRNLEYGNERLEQAQRIAHVGHWEWDIVTNDLAWSDEIYRIFGLQPQEFAATYPAFLEYIHPEDREAVEAAVGRAVAGDEEYDIKHRIVRPDGTIRAVHESGIITWSEDGRPLRMLGVVNDITEQVQAERALSENNVYLRTVVDTVQAALIISDPDENIVMANQAAADMLGYTLEELKHVRPRAFVHPDDAAAIAKRTRARAQGIESEPNFRRRMVRKDGTSLWVEASPSILWIDGEIAGRVAEYRDISHQIAIEQELLDRTDYLQSIFDAVQATLLVADTNDNIVAANQSASDMLGYSHQELLQLNTSALHHPDEREAYAERRRQRVQGAQMDPGYRRRLVRKDGSSIWVESSPSPLRINDRVTGYVGEFRDISRQLAAEAQLEDSATRLELAQTMAHVGSWGRSLVGNDNGYWSDEMYRIFGHEPAAVSPPLMGYLDQIHPDDHERYALELRDFRDERSDTYEAQARFIGADGVERILRMYGQRTRDEDGKPVRLDGTAQDITAQAEAEAQLETARQRLAEELERARDVQRAFQPGTSAKFQMLSVAGQCLPAREVGGDFFDWAPFDDGGVRITIGDVMGKGIPAAIFMSMTQTALRASGRPDAGTGSGPAGQLSRVNRALYPYLDAAESFVTAFTAEVDRDGHFSYADAGHGHALVRRRDSTFVELRSVGLPIGVAGSTTYVSGTAQLGPGDTLLLMTDGLRDLLDSAVAGGQWTDLLGSAVDAWDDPQRAAAEIVRLAQQAAPEDGPDDDLTIIVLSYQGAPSSPDASATPTGQLELTVPPTLGTLAAAEADLQLFLRQLRVGDQRSGAMLTAVHEILANIVEHAKPSADVALAIEVSEEMIAVTTRDDGILFDARDAARAAQAANDRGRGLSMCQILLDRADYSRTDEHNQWRLEMNLTPASPVAAP